MAEAPAYLALCDRAYALLVERGAVAEGDLLAHVFGGAAPAAVREHLLGPLRRDPRVRCAEGVWTLAAAADRDTELSTLCVACLSIAATGPRPDRDRLLRVAAARTDRAARFAITLNPAARIPRYVGRRVRIQPEVDDPDRPNFGDVIDDLLAFLDDTDAVCAQEAALAWDYLEHEARRLGRTLRPPALLDVNDLADLLLELPTKPSLPLIAGHLGIGVVHEGAPEDEARVIAEVLPELLRRAIASGLRSFSELQRALRTDRAQLPPLRRWSATQGLPDTPGVYLLRDSDDDVLYVGKARRLRSRLQAYVQRPLGATRRLEGLAERVAAIDTQACGSDLEALVLEGREIGRLRPRFNTQQRVGPPRLWVSPTLEPPARPGKRQLAPPRLRVCDADAAAGSDAQVGPFRNQALAQAAVRLARELFDLDALRRSGERSAFTERLRRACQFLSGDAAERDLALDRVRVELAAVRAARAHADAWRLERLLRRALAYDPTEVLLPADPAQARFAVVRPAADGGVDVLVVDRGLLYGRASVEVGDPRTLEAVLAEASPRTELDDRDVVLRWLGAQRPPARLLLLPDEPEAALALLVETSAAVAASDA
jgi:DNA polymerase III subunit epsilon